ncbi:accessory gland protein Acp29AB [Drosophila ananassae]|uniref:accessory gland protein Acp29AB n=1 Tax=Drosophila ananassae TaxID=7217 RepID=UPI0013A5EB0B|nr:accessory gland protein Acp29AB [Drosophila ananassae]
MEAQLATFEAKKRKNNPDLEKYIKIGSRYFYIENMNKMSWFAAHRVCREIGGKLATIKDEEELEQIDRLLDFRTGYWLGLNDLVFEGLFQSWPPKALAWIEDHFTNFPNGASDYGHKTDCVVLSGSDMFDIECDKNRYFICEALIDD